MRKKTAKYLTLVTEVDKSQLPGNNPLSLWILTFPWMRIPTGLFSSLSLISSRVQQPTQRFSFARAGRGLSSLLALLNGHFHGGDFGEEILVAAWTGLCEDLFLEDNRQSAL